MNARIREIDVLRAAAILLMVLFHTIVDLTNFYGFSFNYMSGFWYYQGKSSAVLFMFLSGVSITLGRHNIKRGLLVFGAGMIITGATYLFDADTYVRFGILHLLGVSMLSYSIVRRLRPISVIVLAAIVLIATYFIPKYAATSLLLPFGIMPLNFASIDYYPLFPWYAVFLSGIAFGKILYAERQPILNNLPQSKPFLLFEKTGQHSLLIYLVHQPILLAILYLINKI